MRGTKLLGSWALPTKHGVSLMIASRGVSANLKMIQRATQAFSRFSYLSNHEPQKLTSSPSSVSRDESAASCGEEFVMLPGSGLRSCLDGASLLFVMFDVVWIPLLLLDPPATSFTVGMEWITRTWWPFRSRQWTIGNMIGVCDNVTVEAHNMQMVCIC